MKKIISVLLVLIVCVVFCTSAFASSVPEEEIQYIDLIQKCFSDPENADFTNREGASVKDKVLKDNMEWYRQGNYEAIHSYLLENVISYEYTSYVDQVMPLATEAHRTVSKQASHVFLPSSSSITKAVEILFTAYNSFYYDITGGGHGGNVVSRLDGWRITIDAVDAPATFDPRPSTSGRQWIRGGKAYLDATVHLYVVFDEHPVDPGDDYGSYTITVVGEAVQ